MRDQNVQTAHAILDLLLTKAAISGKVGNYKLRIPHYQLVPDSFEYEDVDIIVTIQTDWEQTKDGEPEITGDFKES